MSQVVTLKRSISREELDEVLQRHEALSIRSTHPWGLVLGYRPEPDAHLVFTGGELEATSPSDELHRELERLADELQARVVFEEEEPLPDEAVAAAPVKTVVLFWPLACFVLLALLVWRW
jgi:hypothetical protein